MHKKTTLLIASLGLAFTHANAFTSYTGGLLSENFDGLGAGASVGATWANNSTLPGWYAYQANLGTMWLDSADDTWTEASRYARSIGQSTQSSLLNLGSSTTSSNRALGSFSQDRDYVFALVLRNNSSRTFDSFTLSFHGEQWQQNALSSDPSMKLFFSYGVFNSFNSGPSNPNTIVPNRPNFPAEFYNGYSRVGGALDFAALKFSDTTLPIDGDAAANRQLLSTTQSFQWQPGEYLVLRWLDDYYFGKTQAMLGIDDLQFTAVPEPSALGFIAVAALCWVGFWIHRKGVAGIGGEK